MTPRLPDDEPDPRWSLANERTLLAYNRTALALLVAGLAVSGSRSVAEVPRWFAAVGLPLIALGGAVAAGSRARFLAVDKAMRNGEPLPPATVALSLPWGIALVAVAAIVAAAIEVF